MARISVDTAALSSMASFLKRLERETEHRVADIGSSLSVLDMRIRAAEKIDVMLVHQRRALDSQAAALEDHARFAAEAVRRYEAAEDAVRHLLLGRDHARRGLLDRIRERWNKAWHDFWARVRKVDLTALVAGIKQSVQRLASTIRLHPEVALLLALPPGLGGPFTGLTYWQMRYGEMAPMYAADDETSSRLRAVLARPEYSRERWRTADAEGRKQMVDALSRDIAATMGVPFAPVGWQHWDDVRAADGSVTTTYGGYTDSTGTITLNSRVLDGDLDNGGPPANTLIHEYRHEFQHEAAERDYDHELVVPEAQRHIWSDNFDNYTTSDFRAYWNQPVERDARGMAGEAT